MGKVTIGDNCQLAPNVAIYTAGHPVHPDSRNSAYEYGIPVSIGDNCWIGGNSVICPGVKIGNNVIIGAGSVVTKDIPDWAIAAGNPCKVIRMITDEDRKYYYKNNESMKKHGMIWQPEDLQVQKIKTRACLKKAFRELRVPVLWEILSE